MSRPRSRPASAPPSRQSRGPGNVDADELRMKIATDPDVAAVLSSESAKNHAFFINPPDPPWGQTADLKDKDARQSTSHRFFKEGWTQAVQFKLLATPAAGARTQEKGVDTRIYQKTSEPLDLRDPQISASRQIKSIYQSSHEVEPNLRYLRHQQQSKKLSKDQVETRWHNSLLKWWSRGDDNVSVTNTDFSVLPAGKRDKSKMGKVVIDKALANKGASDKASYSGKEDKGNGEKAAKNNEDQANTAVKKVTKNSNDETQFDQPSAWAMDRAQEPKKSQYLSQCHRVFVKPVADAVSDLKGRYGRTTQQSSQSMYNSLEQDNAVTIGAQESSYQFSYGKGPKGRKKRLKKSNKVFHDI